MMRWYIKQGGLYLGRSHERRWVPTRNDGAAVFFAPGFARDALKRVRKELPMGLGATARIINFDPRRVK